MDHFGSPALLSLHNHYASDFFKMHFYHPKAQASVADTLPLTIFGVLAVMIPVGAIVIKKIDQASSCLKSREQILFHIRLAKYNANALINCVPESTK
jgi:hypothetical protein